MITKFVEAVRGTFKSYGFAKVESNEETGGEFLVGYKGKLYQIDNDYQVARFSEKYITVGSGEQYALAAMYAARNLPPRKRIMTALRTAAKFNIGVTGPFYIYKY
jgi:ATP-dependent protease HslVU (ClpYQ) peptidase subunit